MRELERQVLLSVLDRKWREHLYEMDYLREGIGLRAYSQRDPLVEYQREGFDMFNAMKEGIREETVGFLFNLEVQVEEEEEEAEIDVDLLAGATPAAPRLVDAGTPGIDHAATADAPRPAHPGQGSAAPKAPQNLTYSAPTEDGEAEVRGHDGDATPTTRTPASAATTCARAARARSTRSATARPAVRADLKARPAGCSTALAKLESYRASRQDSASMVGRRTDRAIRRSRRRGVAGRVRQACVRA